MTARTTEDLPRLLTADEVCEQFRSISRHRLYQLARRGKIPAIKLGRAYRFALPALQARSGVMSDRAIMNIDDAHPGTVIADRLARARARREELRVSRAGTMPRCTKWVGPPILPGKGSSGSGSVGHPCGTRTIQNDAERARGVYWCPRCRTYPWGSGGGLVSGGPDEVPQDAYNQKSPRPERGKSE